MRYKKMKSQKILLVVFFWIGVFSLNLQGMTASQEQDKAAQSDPRLAEWAKLPPPNIEKVKPFLGVWESRKKSDGHVGSVTTFEVRDGVVRARHIVDEATVSDLSQESDRARKRDVWQRPGEVMDAMAAKPGHHVADIGCGFGYFTFRLAARVGDEGKVYAVDIEEEAIEKVRRRKVREKLEQVEPILGESADPRLPNDLDSVLIVDTYHEFRDYDRMMRAVFRALKPGGRLVIIDGEGPSGKPRTEYHRLHTIPAELVREEVARHGFVFKESRPGFHDSDTGKKLYFLIFERPLPDQDPKLGLIASAF
jgi:predicted methyltransferase